MMRLAHGSGSAGLGAMSSGTKDSIFIFRPLSRPQKHKLFQSYENSLLFGLKILVTK